MATKTIKDFGSWVKMRNNILIAFDGASNGDKAVKIYSKMLKNGEIQQLKIKYL